MGKLRPLALAGIGAVWCGWARAADLPPAPSLPPLSPAETEFGGWYLRGDVAVGLDSTGPELQTAPNPIAPAGADRFVSPTATQKFNDTTLSPFGMIDIGAGYQLNSWFRADATLEYRAGAGLQSQYALTDPALPTFAGSAQYADFYRADVASIVGLVNGYANLGTWYGLSPFLGAGVGFANNKLSGFTDQGLGYADYRSPGPTGGNFASASKTSFAWALMAGVDFDVTPNLRLELGYRYLDYGAIATGGSNCVAGESGGTFSLANCRGGGANTIASRNRLASNDFRLGLIYLIGEAPPPPVVARD
jgi:opacity protein-like surface antigen